MKGEELISCLSLVKDIYPTGYNFSILLGCVTQPHWKYCGSSGMLPVSHRAVGRGLGAEMPVALTKAAMRESRMEQGLTVGD